MPLAVAAFRCQEPTSCPSPRCALHSQVRCGVGISMSHRNGMRRGITQHARFVDSTSAHRAQRSSYAARRHALARAVRSCAACGCTRSRRAERGNAKQQIGNNPTQARTNGTTAAEVPSRRPLGQSTSQYRSPRATSAPELGLSHAGQYDAIVTLGCVIKGETMHFEYTRARASARTHA